jgi:hypothetical protein
MYLTINNRLQSYLSFLAAQVRFFDLSPAVLSVIATEMYFRNSLFRLAEYFAWIVLWHFYPKRIEILSVGIAQVQIRTWVELGLISSRRPSFSNLWAVANVENNYIACQRYLNQVGSTKEIDPKVLSELYSGKARTFHSNVIATAYEAAVRISLTKASSRRAKCGRG